MEIAIKKDFVSSSSIVPIPKPHEKKHRTRCEVYSRVVGYLRPVDQWNNGKREEFYQRRTFELSEVEYE